MEVGERVAKVYRILSRAYLQPPDHPYLDALSSWADGLLTEAKGESLPEGIAAALELIQDALKSGVERQLQELQQEYVRL
ncbi:MAG: hypothetical protein ACE5LD_02785, partial [Candidatus Bipolaricaulia bacterium]